MGKQDRSANSGTGGNMSPLLFAIRGYDGRETESVSPLGCVEKVLSWPAEQRLGGFSWARPSPMALSMSSGRWSRRLPSRSCNQGVSVTFPNGLTGDFRLDRYFDASHSWLSGPRMSTLETL